MKSRIQITYGEKSAKEWQQYQTFVLVAKQIFGNEKKKNVEPPKTADEAKAQWLKMFPQGLM